MGHSLPINFPHVKHNLLRMDMKGVEKMYDIKRRIVSVSLHAMLRDS